MRVIEEHSIYSMLLYFQLTPVHDIDDDDLFITSFRFLFFSYIVHPIDSTFLQIGWNPYDAIWFQDHFQYLTWTRCNISRISCHIFHFSFNLDKIDMICSIVLRMQFVVISSARYFIRMFMICKRCTTIGMNAS